MQVAPINHIEIRNDRPVIARTGHKVAIIANMYVQGDAPIDWIVENYDLTPAEIHAALSYYYDHAEELDRYLEEGDALVRKIGISTDEHIEQIRRRSSKNASDTEYEQGNESC
jgi:uncharacterized protein (DUF433 family)